MRKILFLARNTQRLRNSLKIEFNWIESSSSSRCEAKLYERDWIIFLVWDSAKEIRCEKLKNCANLCWISLWCISFRKRWVTHFIARGGDENKVKLNFACKLIFLNWVLSEVSWKLKWNDGRVRKHEKN